ncbi:PblB [Streptococcus pneumoniae]|nr:PblB [Streptococcus pneumoniae]
MPKFEISDVDTSYSEAPKKKKKKKKKKESTFKQRANSLEAGVSVGLRVLKLVAETIIEILRRFEQVHVSFRFLCIHIFHKKMSGRFGLYRLI